MRVPADVMDAISVKSAKRAKDGKDVFAITPVVITGYDAKTRTLTIQLTEP